MSSSGISGSTISRLLQMPDMSAGLKLMRRSAKSFFHSRGLRLAKASRSWWTSRRLPSTVLL